ncbi:winged helix DNA-binding domain-containing protein [Nonomuraea sp. SBT364]|uniref:winged helix DNA-binding domain-containing protein n=1 Tax=Nonomuraea sp. SBT364 TaxID=1580530 RepID=UPI00066AFF6D|nr:winged helix DNA-binding domain-containing protein [Nonomuraea sp. SBT364]
MITLRDLNRATLARQLLLRRHAMPALEAVEHLVGLQAQAPFPPYFGLWSRLSAFVPGELARLLEERHVVRLVLMRGTVHLVSAADSLTLRPLTQPQLTRFLHSAYGGRVAALDLEAVVAAGRRALAGGPLTGAALGNLLAGEFPGAQPADLAQIMRILVPLVQVPPRAVWGRSGQTAYATVESWLGRDPHPSPSPETLVLRYLAAFGPATVADAQAWSGLTGLREVVERLRPRLVTLPGPGGRELFDLPDAPRPGGAAPAPVRLLAPFDNLLLSHADRTRVISDADRARVITVNGQVLGTVLVDGFVHGTWKRDKSVVTVELFRPVTGGQAAEIRAEAAALLEFAAPGGRHEVRGV